MSITTQLHWNKDSKIGMEDIEILTNILIDSNFTISNGVYDRTINLRNAGWRFEWSNRRRAFGNVRVHRGVKRVMMSSPLCSLNLNSPLQCEDTIRHEIAHAIQWELSNYMSHDREWVRIAKMIACNGERCYKRQDVASPTGNYRLECSNCGTVTHIYRKPKRNKGCGVCCKQFNGGRYTDLYKLTLFTN